MLPVGSCFLPKGDLCKMGEYLPDGTEEPICIDPLGWACPVLQFSLD